MVSEQQHDIACVQGGYADDEYADSWILRRNYEGEPRSNQLGHTNIRMIGGLRGEITENWNYDLYWLLAQNDSQTSYVNDLSIELRTRRRP